MLSPVNAFIAGRHQKLSLGTELESLHIPAVRQLFQNHDGGAPGELDHSERTEQRVRVPSDVRYPVSTRSLKRAQIWLGFVETNGGLGETERGDDE